MTKISSYVVEYQVGRQRYSSRVIKGYQKALEESKAHLRDGATMVTILGFDKAGHCILRTGSTRRHLIHC